MEVKFLNIVKLNIASSLLPNSSTEEPIVRRKTSLRNLKFPIRSSMLYETCDKSDDLKEPLNRSLSLKKIYESTKRRSYNVKKVNEGKIFDPDGKNIQSTAMSAIEGI